MENKIEIGGVKIVLTIGEEKVAINRVKLEKCAVPSKFNAINSFNFKSILGLWTINTTKFLVLITDSKPITELFHIEQVTSYRIVQLSNKSEDKESYSLLEEALNISPMYFSTTRDLSVNSRLQGYPSRMSFAWNYSAKVDAEGFFGMSCAQTVITGFVSSFKTQSYEFLLISRRSPNRSGTRFWVRGADSKGNTANYVETEQFLSTSHGLYSLIQLRGSIPLIWKQEPDFSRLPPITLAPTDQCREALHLHFDRLKYEYGHLTCCSLTDTKGRETELTATYNTLGAEDPDVNFVYFDFHHECRKLHYENVSKLISQIQADIDEYGYTFTDTSGAEQMRQKGVVRTNCVDSLDRTNVVQSAIARQLLEKWLAEEGEQFSCDAQFREAWTQNADALAMQYAGTPALKTDYTRTGKRTVGGMIKDGQNAVVRYVVNTCMDGKRQDLITTMTKADVFGMVEKKSVLEMLLLFLMILALQIVTLVYKNNELKKMLVEKKRRFVNRPAIRVVGALNDEQLGNVAN